ncbi:MAG: hypothetical protein R3Y64_00220 [Peptostreptococcaceae bacterium]
MQKIGLNICKNYTMKYFDKIIQSEILKLNEIDQISSISIYPKIIDTFYMSENSFIKILFNIDIKILYLTKNCSSINLYENSFSNVKHIFIDNFIDGNIVNLSFVKSKINFEIFIEEIFSKILDIETIFYSYHIIFHIKYNESLYLGFLIQNGLSKNLYLSYSSCNNLVQKTFDNNMKYKNIIFSNNLSFIGEFKNSSLIYIVDNKNNLVALSGIRNANSFCYKNNSQIIVSINISTNSFLFIYDINAKSLKKLPKPPVSNFYINPYFDKLNLNIYCLSNINKINTLCFFDKNYKFHVLIQNEDILWFKFFENNILFESDKIKMFSIDFDDCFDIEFSFEFDKILKIEFFDTNSLLVLFEINSTNNLLIYDINTFFENELCSFYSIIDFCIDKNTKEIFILYDENNSSLVMKIDENFDEYYLEDMSSNISNIFIKEIF